METKSGNSLTETLTEDWYCPRHALTYQEAYQLCNVYFAYSLKHGQWTVPLTQRPDYWKDQMRKVPCICYTCAQARVTFCLEQAAFWHKKLVDSIAIEGAQKKLSIELGPREFTLTYSPSWYESDEDAQHAMSTAIERLTRYYKDEIIEFHAVGEFTRDGRSHVHAWYHLSGGRKITDKNFKRAYPHWNPKRKLGKGFEGGHHATITRVSDFSGYTEKHLEEAWLNIHITNGPREENPHSLSTREETDA